MSKQHIFAVCQNIIFSSINENNLCSVCLGKYEDGDAILVTTAVGQTLAKFANNLQSESIRPVLVEFCSASSEGS